MPFYQTVESTTGGAATITLAADGGVTHVLQYIGFSYSGVPLITGKLTIKFGSTLILELDVPSTGFGFIPQEWIGNVDESMEIKLSGLTGLKAKLAIKYSEA